MQQRALAATVAAGSVDIICCSMHDNDLHYYSINCCLNLLRDTFTAISGITGLGAYVVRTDYICGLGAYVVRTDYNYGLGVYVVRTDYNYGLGDYVVRTDYDYGLGVYVVRRL